MQREGWALPKQPPVDSIFNYMMKHLWGETDGSVKLLHAPEVRAAANLAFIMRWLKRGPSPVDGHNNVMQLMGIQCSQ